jgi:hypothetical protein
MNKLKILLDDSYNEIRVTIIVKYVEGCVQCVVYSNMLDYFPFPLRANAAANLHLGSTECINALLKKLHICKPASDRRQSYTHSTFM